MLLGSIRCRALEKERDHHLRRATEAPGAAARNAQPPVNGQAKQTTTRRDASYVHSRAGPVAVSEATQGRRCTAE
jgi:hypothetical protein